MTVLHDPSTPTDVGEVGLDVRTAQRFAKQITTLQQVWASYAEQKTNDTSTWATTGLTATIQRKDSASSIRITVFQNGLGKSTGNTYCGVRLVRDGTALETFERQAGQNGGTGDNWVGGAGTVYLDTPTSIPPLTSMHPIIYKTEFISGANIATAYVQTGPSRSTMLLEEVV